MKTKLHKLKIEKKYLLDLVSGDKKFEIRFNDRDYHVDDFLQFKYKENVYIFRVRYIHSGLGLQENYVCMTVDYLPYSSKVTNLIAEE